MPIWPQVSGCLGKLNSSKAEDKLQQAQQNADLASNQRSALETQLKQAQDKLQQAQQNADLASSQRAAWKPS